MEEIKGLKAIPLLPSVGENETLKTKEHLGLAMGAERDDPWRWHPPAQPPRRAARTPLRPHGPPRHSKAPGPSCPGPGQQPQMAPGQRDLQPQASHTRYQRSAQGEPSASACSKPRGLAHSAIPHLSGEWSSNCPSCR